MPFPAEMDPFQSEVGGDQGLVAKWQAKYRAIVPDALPDEIPRVGLPANAGNQRFFEKRQSEANIDDKPIPPKRADRRRFSSEQPGSRPLHLPIASRAGRQLRHPWPRSSKCRQLPEVINGNCPQGLSAVTRPW